MLYAADGRRLRRQIGFLPEYRVEAEDAAPFSDVYLVGFQVELEPDEIDETENSRAAR